MLRVSLLLPCLHSSLIPELVIPPGCVVCLHSSLIPEGCLRCRFGVLPSLESDLGMALIQGTTKYSNPESRGAFPPLCLSSIDRGIYLVH
jgi:hypothetical protein